MTLDITQIGAQIGEMVGRIKTDSRERSEHLKAAMTQLNDPGLNLEALKRKIAASRTPNWSPAQAAEYNSKHSTIAALTALLFPQNLRGASVPRAFGFASSLPNAGHRA